MTKENNEIIGTLIDIVQHTDSMIVDDEDKNPFMIVSNWSDLATIQRELNKRLNPKAYYEWAITYYNEYGKDAFQEMRLGKDENGNPTSTTRGSPRYEIPDGLTELDELINWGFSDEYSTCDECGQAIRTSKSHYGDKPRYVVLDCAILCGNCIAENHEEEYIESRINNAKNAINTNIISEDRLEELGWKKLETRYENGLHRGQDDNPSDVLTKLKENGDILFTYDVGQFDVNFWAWVKKQNKE